MSNNSEGEDSHVETGQMQFSLDELIASTVRAMTIREAVQMSAKEVEGLIPEFAGNADEDVVSWFRRIAQIRERYNVSQEKLLLAVVNKLKGRALEWFHSKPEHITFGLQELEEHMTSMFCVKEDYISLRRRFEARKWKKSEQFSSYYMDKVMLGYKHFGGRTH